MFFLIWLFTLGMLARWHDMITCALTGSCVLSMLPKESSIDLRPILDCHAWLLHCQNLHVNSSSSRNYSFPKSNKCLKSPTCLFIQLMLLRLIKRCVMLVWLFSYNQYFVDVLCGFITSGKWWLVLKCHGSVALAHLIVVVWWFRGHS